MIDHAPVGHWNTQAFLKGLRHNLPAHRRMVAAEILKEIDTWFLFLPKDNPGMNTIEKAFSTLKALIRRVAART